MESRIRSSSSPHHPMIQFPVSLGCTLHDQPKTPRKVVDEMDFFANKMVDDGGCDSDHAQDVAVHLRNSVSDLNVNTGLHLHTSSENGATVDDRICTNSENKRAKNEQQMLSLLAERERLTTENRQLKEMLNQVTNDYNKLQLHVATMSKKRTDQNSEHKHEEQQTNGKGNIGVAVLQQSMDLRFAAKLEVDINRGEENVQESKVPRLESQSTRTVDQATESTMRKARVSVRARSEAPMISDGCQWRKYGQKMAKGNPCPRAYYRCTMGAGCPVRKQVQRCADDSAILVTTYEGSHNHPLPPAAIPMVSTTSSAARMLLSGTMPSADGLMNSNFLARALLPCSSSMATISASAPFPTVTLDMTNSPDPLQCPRTSNQFPLPFLKQTQNSHPAVPLLPQIFGQALYNQSKFSGLQMSQQIDQSHSNNHGQPSQTQLSPEIVNALAADPNFTAALAAAISSIVSGSYQSNNRNGDVKNNNGSITTTSNDSNGHSNKKSPVQTIK